MKLYRFRYSPYARKVQIVLELMGVEHQVVEVPYGDRDELAKLTSGYIYVPVLVDDTGAVLVESRTICEKLVATAAGKKLVPAPFQGPIWAYADFCDGPLEDVLFRLASPSVRDAWEKPGDRALYVLIKERKFGAGCVDAWERDRSVLLEKAQHLLAPSLATFGLRPFLFGDTPTLGDAALYGNCVMLEEAEPGLLERVSPNLVAFVRRVDAARVSAGSKD
jgi:glutathione S-transferase